MKIILIIPPTSDVPAHLAGKHELALKKTDPRSRYSFGVIVDKDDEVLDGHRFELIRDTLFARIATSDAAAVCGALGLECPQPGINEYALEEFEASHPRHFAL